MKSTETLLDAIIRSTYDMLVIIRVLSRIYVVFFFFYFFLLLNSKYFLIRIIDRYAGEVRYALVYTVFVEPIEIQVHNLPFSIRKPRPVRLAASNTGHLYLRLRKALQKVKGKDDKIVKSSILNVTLYKMDIYLKYNF